MVLAAATELLTSIQVIIAHSREAGVDRERAERQSDQMRAYIESRMLGEQAIAPHMDGFESTLALMQSVHDREKAFLRSFHALMVLWSAEDIRDLVENAFSALEEVRLLAAEPLTPPITDWGDDDGGNVDLDRVRSLISTMGDRMKDRRQRWEDKARKEMELLERAHEVARSIFTKVQSTAC